MKIINYAVGVSLICVCFSGSGCANYIRDISTVTQETDRRIISTKYELKVYPEPIKDASCQVEIHKLESAEIKKYEVRTERTIATPYQWWREFYEIPSGIGLLPVSLGSHLLFLCSFGILPYDVPQAVNDLAFAGMNPALGMKKMMQTMRRFK